MHVNADKSWSSAVNFTVLKNFSLFVNVFMGHPFDNVDKTVCRNIIPISWMAYILSLKALNARDSQTHKSFLSCWSFHTFRHLTVQAVPGKPERDAKTVARNIERQYFSSTRITGYRLKNVA